MLASRESIRIKGQKFFTCNSSNCILQKAKKKFVLEIPAKKNSLLIVMFYDRRSIATEK